MKKNFKEKLKPQDKKKCNNLNHMEEQVQKTLSCQLMKWTKDLMS